MGDLTPLPGRPLDWDGQEHGPCVAVPFPQATDPAPMHAAGWHLLRYLAGQAPVTLVPLSALVATQGAVAVRTLTQLPPDAPPPLVVRWQGRLWLNDGHHRATAAWVRGEQQIAARLLDLDALLTEAHGRCYTEYQDGP